MKSCVLSVVLVAVLGVGHASASGMQACTADPAAFRMSTEQAKARARMMGYKVTSVEPDQGCWRIEATDDRGRRQVLRMHASTGELMARFMPDAIDPRATAATD